MAQQLMNLLVFLTEWPVDASAVVFVCARDERRRKSFLSLIRISVSPISPAWGQDLTHVTALLAADTFSHTCPRLHCHIGQNHTGNCRTGSGSSGSGGSALWWISVVSPYVHDTCGPGHVQPSSAEVATLSSYQIIFDLTTKLLPETFDALLWEVEVDHRRVCGLLPSPALTWCSYVH